MLPRLKYKNMEPPGGWIYRDLDTNMWITAHNGLDDLISKCRAHRMANGLPIPEDFAERVEASIAYSVPPELAVDMPESRKIAPRMRTQYQVNKITSAFLTEWRLKFEMKKVSQEVAEKRADICKTCKHNNRDICLPCQGLDVWINGWTKSKTKSDPVLGVCDHDGLISWATVHADVKHNGTFPKWCWKIM